MNQDLPSARRVCIVTPCYNDGHLLPEAIASIRACKPDLYEHIIVNDGSTDPPTLRYLDQLRSEGARVIDQPNSGPSAARNAAIRATQCELILPVDADNRIFPDFIPKAIDVMDADADCSMVYTDVRLFGEASGDKKIPEPSLEHLIRSNYIDTCAVFRKSLWTAVGGYDENRECGWEDWDFWMKAMCLGHKFHHVPEVLYEYRVKTDSRSLSFVDGTNQRVSSDYLKSRKYPIQYKSLLQATDHWKWIRESARKNPVIFPLAVAKALIRALLASSIRDPRD